MPKHSFVDSLYCYSPTKHSKEEKTMFGISLRRGMLSTALLCVLGLAASGTMLMAHAAETEYTAKVKAAMSAMKSDTAKLGAPKAEGDILYFGSTKMNGNFELVDGLKSRFGGTATLFVKKGSTFVRISTNVMKDGKRAVGTQLDPNGPAIAAIRQGNAYYGIVDILGKMYDTGYEPIKTAKGDVVGIYYVGYLME